MKFKFVILIALFTFFVNAQNVNVGPYLGLPVGKISKKQSLNFGVDVNLMWEFDKETKAGVTTGLSYLSGKSLEVGNEKLSTDGVLYLPVAASVDYHLYDQFYTGADIGITLIVRKADAFKFYFQPKFGMIINDEMRAFSSLRIIDGGMIVGLGFGYTIL